MVSPADRLRRWASRHPVSVDALLAALLVGASSLAIVVGPGRAQGRPLTVADAAAIVIAVVAITLRRRLPRGTLFAVVAAQVAHLGFTGEIHPLLVLTEGLAAYTMALSTDRRTTWRLAAGCAAALYLGNTLLLHRSYWPAEVVPMLAFVGMATAVGDATRSRKAYLAEVEERARRAEQTREEEAQRRVIQERLRIARELHDVIAHHIAVINVQANAANHLLDRRPSQVRPALDHIRQAGDTVLQELASIIGVLRQSDDADSTTEPARGLARLPELLDAAAAAGLTVHYQQTGAPRQLPALVDLAAYRIVQEALTNAHKHGRGVAGLTIAYTPTGVGINVVNSIAAGVSTAGSGYGLVGMRERAAAAEGRFDAYASPDGRFTVHAVLPARHTPALEESR
ncbi:sensor histidine kinase [Actinoplanes subtropicus]|uniref:sensor histidine kinase n=1 Tax=Actinoplanes subtropicus TaxID=543632 RepID=UPI0004C3CFA7|nr:histidine kinase [Actinoplanes subtropicus]